MKTKKELIENAIRKIVKEELGDGDLVTKVSEEFEYNRDQLFDFFIKVLRNCNFKTEAKYIGRMFADIENAGRIENSNLYKSGLY